MMGENKRKYDPLYYGELRSKFLEELESKLAKQSNTYEENLRKKILSDLKAKNWQKLNF